MEEKKEEQYISQDMENLMKKNLLFLATVDLETYITDMNYNYKIMYQALAEFIMLLRYDDALVYKLRDGTLTEGDLEGVFAMVETLQDESLFLTLVKNNEDLFKDIFGIDIFKAQEERYKKLKVKKVFKNNGDTYKRRR